MATGILLSRILGLVRQRILGHFLGTSAAADAFNAAFRIPNFLQNLFGEGTLSASFIPVYSRLVASGEREEARRVAGAVAALLGLITSVIVLAGVLATPVLIDLIAPGFSGEKRDLTIHLVRILFPGAGLLVLSAWCLGVLNSHHRFLLSYAAPVIWNLAIILALLTSGNGTSQFQLAEIAAWASVVGSALQFVVQLPAVLRLLGGVRVRLGTPDSHTATVISNFGPVFVGRGVVQISGYIDTIIGSLLPTGAVAGLGYAQILYTLPVSLFGLSVSAAELPAMSSAGGNSGEVAAYLRGRLDSGLGQIAFWVVPSVVAFLVLGDVIVGALYQTGEFGRAQTLYVWAILAGATVGLLASTMGRLYASTYYAMRDTRTPLRYALIRVGLGIVLGYIAAILLPPRLGIEARWGAAGLAAASGFAGWIEFLLLRHTLNHRIGRTGVASGLLVRLWGAALVGAGAGWGVKLLLGLRHPMVVAIFVLGAYGLGYLGVTRAIGVPQARTLLDRTARLVVRK